MKTKLSWTALMVVFFLVPALASANSDQEAALQRLFAPVPQETKSQVRAGVPAFLFWIQGAADHFVTPSGSTTEPLSRADAEAEKQVEALAQTCGECNLAILHNQRGGARWYTAKKPWATYLRIYSQGRKILERRVDLINSADPEFLSRFMILSASVFGQSPLHLIYRGHSLMPRYQPAMLGRDSGRAPFDYGFPESPYGIEEFSTSLERASVRLASVTFAACRMAYLEVARRIAPFARYLIASQVAVLETLNAGFDFSFLSNPALAKMKDSQVSELIAKALLKRFLSLQPASDAMMETPATWIDLRGFEKTAVELNGFLASLPANVLARAAEAAHVKRGLSKRYVQDLRNRGLSKVAIEQQLKFIQLASPDEEEVDLGLVLNELAPIGPEALRLKKMWSERVRVIEPGASSVRLGVSYRVPLR